MRCNRKCFECDRPDCDYEPQKRAFTPEQKARAKARLHERRAQARERGICVLCMKRSATSGYSTCTDCRARHRTNERERRHRIRTMPRVLFDGVERCVICGQYAPIANKTICARCYENCLKNLRKGREE